MRFLLIAIIALTGCYSPQKAIKQANKAIKEHPEEVLPLFRAKFPCDIVQVDTSIIYTDTVINIECPPQDNPGYITDRDTVFHVIFKNAKPVTITKTIQLPSRTITKYVRDSALVRELQLKLLVCETNYAVDLKELDKTKAGIKKRNYLIFSLILLLIIAILTHFIRRR